MTTNPTAKIIIIGTELLTGRIEDENINFLATELHKLGIHLLEARIIADDKAVIVETVNALRPGCDYLFVTGGIGPTHDDVTAVAIAEAFGVEIERNPEAVELLHRKYPGEQLYESRLKMADIPVSASLIYNDATSAPGFIMENVYVMAGIPFIMQAMFHGLKDQLRIGNPFISKSLITFLSEGVIAKAFSELQLRYPSIMMGSYPAKDGGKWHTTLVLMGMDENAIELSYEDLKAMVINLNGEIVKEE